MAGRITAFQAALVLAFSLLGTGAANAAARIVLAGKPPTFRVEGAATLKRGPAPDFADILQVGVDTPGAASMAGSYRLDGGVLSFTPQFPLDPGVTYRATYRFGGETASASFLIPKAAPAPSTEVTHIFPTASVLPENELKVYIHFSAPMSRGGALRWIHLVADDGTEVKLPFLRLEEELWDAQNTRLTVLFDPGRIKRGLVPNAQMGLALREGHRYTMKIDPGWPDARGIPLKAGFAKTFTVGPPDRTPLDVKQWKIAAPAAGTRQALAVDFPEPIDAALLNRVIEVKDSQGKPVPGAISVEREETRWSFTPAAAWRAGGYRLDVPGLLEDLAGNQIDRAFDVDVIEHPEQQRAPKIYTLPFTVAAPR